MKEKQYMGIPPKKRWAGFLALIVIFLLSTTTVYGGGKNKMEYLYDNFGNSIPLTLPPQIYKIDTRSSVSLFPVPFDNAVGTNDLRNAITVISFPKGKLDMENHFRSLFDDVRGGGTFLPVIPPDSIGFGQTRRFLLFNFKTGSHKKFRLFPSIDEKIENIAIADGRRKLFIVEAEGLDRHSEDHNDGTFFLQLFDLSGDEAKPIKKIDIGTGSIWTVAHDRLFLWYFSKKIMEVYDLNLEPVQHPLGEVIKKHRDKVDFNQMTPHPALPFSIFSGGEFGSIYISWGEGRNQAPRLLLSGATQFSFSPDGKWVTFKQFINLREERTYLMPVSEKYPNYLGSPILLVKNNYFDPPYFAWTTNPVSFVGSDRSLYRWELTKEAQKSIMGDDYDKYPTFHDYIVAKDLEKLTKEKKQGLGK
jgi:hypothetical protein